MSTNTQETSLSQKRLVLTRDVSGHDYPIWKGQFPRYFVHKDDLYCLGVNLLVWFRDEEKGNYYPGIVNPADVTNNMTYHKEIKVPSPTSMIFLAGRRMDLLIHPLYVEDPARLVINELAEFKVHFIENGAISKTESINLKGMKMSHRFSKHNLRLYQDKFLVLVNDKILQLYNIYTGCETKRIENVPTDGALVLDKNNAVIWSQMDSRKAIVNLETGASTSVGLEQIDPDMTILGFSAQNLLVGNNEKIYFYNPWGYAVLKRELDYKVTEIFDGVVEQYASTNLAFVLRTNGVGTVCTFRDGNLYSHRIGKIATRSLLLYEELVYVPKNYTSLDMWIISALDNQTIDFRYMKVSPSLGYVLENRETILDANNSRSLVIRSPACRPMDLTISIKRLSGVPFAAMACKLKRFFLLRKRHVPPDQLFHRFDCF